MQDDPPPRKSRAVQLRDALENAIVEGVYGCGERLDEARLAQQYGVSRTPVREALLQLAATDLVEMRPNRGAFVTAMDPAALIEMFEVMAELEGMCGRLAARRITPERQTALLMVHHACERAHATGDPDAYYYANERFHNEIYASSQNAFLARQAKALHNRLRPFRRMQLRVPGRVDGSSAEHERIIDAIIAGDPERAERELKAHILIQGNRFQQFMAVLGPEARRLPPAPEPKPDSAARGLRPMA